MAEKTPEEIEEEIRKYRKKRQAERTLAWRKANQERYNAYQREWRRKKRDSDPDFRRKEIERSILSHKKNIESYKAAQRRYYYRHRDEILAKNRAKRAEARAKRWEQKRAERAREQEEKHREKKLCKRDAGGGNAPGAGPGADTGGL